MNMQKLPLYYLTNTMINLQLKEELISKIQADPRIWKAVDIRYEEYPQVQKNAIKAYDEIMSRLCAELEK